jgi:hypothetical protein
MKAIARIQADRLAAKPAAKSLAHQGVTARPMDRGLSRITEQKRMSLRQRGTSVARLGQTTPEEDPLFTSDGALAADTIAAGATERRALTDANAGKQAAKRGTSVNRLYTPEKDLRLREVPPSTTSSEAIDLPI